ncbi:MULTISPECIES: 2-C-methyl-D-erythritol 4-phosphate cytidylyltransferase [Sphingobacterium]|uniref:2-C-methyl-D-erythritol 4-phosphate cytidylyltransferase n=1 Tax=Sphingobacterium populi TaxID=1812824 RepID=A0ABW5UF63_9SPHI|nr:2-C-methyl-D-erythritol 4-phosphate cytidylyltransferase [Sphingobacterium sp. CFCC 11742]
MARKFVVIVAGGVGSRMNSTLPKQFHLLADLPVLMHTIRRFELADLGLHIIVVLSSSMHNYWRELCDTYQFTVPHLVVAGGTSRFQSVKNGLEFIKSTFTDSKFNHDAIAVHDGARPLVSVKLIRELFEKVAERQAIVPAVRSTNSIRLGNKDKSECVNRNDVWQVQTPQVFAATSLLVGYEQNEEAHFTDDASVVEKMGNIVSIVEGDYFNLKITHPEDLDIAQIYLSRLGI